MSRVGGLPEAMGSRPLTSDLPAEGPSDTRFLLTHPCRNTKDRGGVGVVVMI